MFDETELKILYSHLLSCKNEELVNLRNKIFDILHCPDISFSSYLSNNYRVLDITLTTISKKKIVKALSPLFKKYGYHSKKYDQYGYHGVKFKKKLVNPNIRYKKCRVVFEIQSDDSRKIKIDKYDDELEIMLDILYKLGHNEFEVMDLEFVYDEDNNGIECKSYKGVGNASSLKYCECRTCKFYINCFLMIINILDEEESKCNVIQNCQSDIHFDKQVFKAIMKSKNIEVRVPCCGCFSDIKRFNFLKNKYHKFLEEYIPKLDVELV